MNLQKYIIFQKMTLCLSLHQRNQAFVWSSHSWIHMVSNWPSGRSVIALAILKLVTISQKDRDAVARIVQATRQKWCLHCTKWRKPLKHLLQTRPAHGTMFFLFHHREKYRVRFTRETQITQFQNIQPAAVNAWKLEIHFIGQYKMIGGKDIETSFTQAYDWPRFFCASCWWSCLHWVSCQICNKHFLLLLYFKPKFIGLGTTFKSSGPNSNILAVELYTKK